MRRLLSVFFVLGWISSPGLASAETKPPRAMLVLDSSGSMWGQIDGVSKVTIAREALRENFRKWDPKIKLGISAYGHRGQGNCNDVETLMAPQKVDEKAFSKAISAVRPNGMTPLTKAVRRAARALAYTSRRATVILLSDGLDNCKADPCAAAAQLKAEAPDFTAHVIAFRMKDEDAEQLACIARNTGGKFLRARDKPALRSALREIRGAMNLPVVKIPATAKRPPVSEPVNETVGQKPRKEVPEKVGRQDEVGRQEEVLKTVIAPPASKPVLVPPKQAAPKQAASKQAAPKQAASKQAAPKQATLPPKAVAKITAQSFRAVAMPGGQPLDQAALAWSVSVKGSGKVVATAAGAKARLQLEPGDYTATAALFGHRFQKDFAVTAGKSGHIEVPVMVGRASLRAVYGVDAKTAYEGLTWRIFAGKKIADKPVISSMEATPSMLLPAGTYTISLERGETRQQRQITVKPGDREEHWIVLQTGLVRVSAVLSDGRPAIKRGVRWDVFSAAENASGKPVAGGYQGRPRFSLLGGRYRIRAKVGLATAAAEIAVKPGKDISRVINLNAGMVRLTAEDENGTPMRSGVRWDVFQQAVGDAQPGRRLGGAHSPRPVFTLSAGDYLVIATAGTAKVETRLSVKAGQTSNIAVSFH